jgi:hypothetical protein
MNLENNLTIFNDLLKEKNNDKNENICLIDGLELKDNYITLECNHKFNYLSLYNEIVYQKTKKILDNSRLRFNEIKCPYCRKITNKLLPFFKYYSVEQIKGVNYPLNYCIKINSCDHIDKNKNKCNNSACITKFGNFCNKHLKYTEKEEELVLNIDNEFYKKYKKKNIKELREELKNFKLKQSGNKDDLIKRLYLKNKDLDEAANEIQETALLYLIKKNNK